MTEIQEIDINLIDLNKEQPRKYFDDAKIEALKKSIAKDGLLQPLVVRPMQDGRYQIIAGECRYRALKELGKTSVLAMIQEADDKKALDLALLENEIRSALSPLEKAEAIEEYKNRNRISYDTIAEILGMTPSNVSNITSLNKLDDKIKEKLRKEPSDYPLRSLMTIARINDPKKQRIAFYALKHRNKTKDEKNSEDAGNKDTAKNNKTKKTDRAKNDSIENDAKQKNIQLIQQTGNDLETICSLDKQVFNDMPELTKNLFNNVAKTLIFFISSDFNALNLDALKTAITDIASKLSDESPTAKD